MQGIIKKDSLTLSWIDIASGDSLVYVQIRVDRGSWEEIEVTSSMADSVTIAIPTFTELGVRIFVSANACLSPYSRELYIIPTSTISEYPVECEINYDPNTGRISVMGDANNYHVYAHDVMGRRVALERDQNDIFLSKNISGLVIISIRNKMTGQLCSSKMWIR